jgi:hypothetical protein
MGVDNVETPARSLQATDEADCRCGQEGRANGHANPRNHRETRMMDSETMAHLLPVDPGISGPVAKAPGGRREIRHRCDDDTFHLSAGNQVAQSILYEHAVARLLGVREQRRKSQQP